MPPTPPPLPEGPPWFPKIPSAGLTPGPLAARVLGNSGPTVTLIHGLSIPAVFWSRTALALARVCRVVLIDNPGFGASRSLTVPLTIGEHAALHAQTLARLDLPKPWHVVGLSLGGMIAIDLADRLGDDAASLLVFASSSRETGWFRLSVPCLLRQVGYLLTRRTDARLREVISDARVAAMPGIYQEIQTLMRPEGNVAWRVARQLVAALRFSTKPHRGRLPALTRVIVGSEDRLVPKANSRRLAELLDAPLRVVEGAGHDFSMDHPETVVEEVWHAMGFGPALP